MKKNKKRKIVWKHVILTLLTLILFKISLHEAYLQRGYRAFGGEYLTVFLPIIYISMEQSLKDVFGDFFKDLFQFIRKEKKKDAS